MKHYIIAKLKDKSRREELAGPVRTLFEELLSVPGIHRVRVKPCCTDISNRYDLMIVIDMDPGALPAYNESEQHKRWKSEYGDLLETKTIFDSED